MNLTSNLLYLLLLYAVLDNGKLSLTTGLLIAFGIMLFNCYFGGIGTNDTSTAFSNLAKGFCSANGI